MDRERCAIPYSLFDGETLPFLDGEFDCVSFIDVLHHTDDPASLIREAARVSGRYVVIKDHVSRNRFDRSVLSFMDWVGNRSYGVRLNYNYLGSRRWQEVFATCGLVMAEKTARLGLYPFPLSLLFERGLHFLVLLEKAKAPQTSV